jgi:hypothetical protein
VGGEKVVYTLRLALLDEHSQPAMSPTPIGDRPVGLSMEFEVGKPLDLRTSTPLDVRIAINLGPLPRQPDHCSAIPDQSALALQLPPHAQH